MLIALDLLSIAYRLFKSFFKVSTGLSAKFSSTGLPTKDGISETTVRKFILHISSYSRYFANFLILCQIIRYSHLKTVFKAEDLTLESSYYMSFRSSFKIPSFLGNPVYESQFKQNFLVDFFQIGNFKFINVEILPNREGRKSRSNSVSKVSVIFD